MNAHVEYLPDASIDETLDQELRALLSICFTKPQDTIFQTQRYFREPYPYRWVIRNPEEAVVAHVGVHEKTVIFGGEAFRIGGIAEVCVHPDYRGQGFVRLMLAWIHDWLRERGFTFALLFGRTEVYHSSGYARVTNLLHGGDEEGWTPVDGMAAELTTLPWPTIEVRLPGPTF